MLILNKRTSAIARARRASINPDGLRVLVRMIDARTFSVEFDGQPADHGGRVIAIARAGSVRRLTRGTL